MRLTIQTDVARIVTSLQTRVVENHYACRDERMCRRETLTGTVEELYCRPQGGPPCPYKYQGPGCLRAKPNRVAAREAERQMLRYRNSVVSPADPDTTREREREANYSQRRVCAWEGCEARISNRNLSGLCMSHCAVLRQRRLSEARPPLSRSQAARSDGRTCTWSECATPITNRAAYCRTHSVIIAQQQLHMMRQEESE